jgi:hypothetical protein
VSEPIETLPPFSANPPRLLADVNYNEHIIRGVQRRRPDIVIITARQAGLERAPDPDVLEYAARHDLILLTHDIHTMPQHFAEFLSGMPEGAFSPGVWYTPQSAPVGVAIQAILEAWLCSDHGEYRNRELRLP